jgi:putative spermidine/putrescine transport system permease protein
VDRLAAEVAPADPAAADPGRDGRAAWRLELSPAARLALIAPFVVLLGLLFVVPLARLVWIAISEPALGLHQLREFLASPAARKAFVNTIRISGVVTVLALGIGTVIAWELRSTRSRARRLLLWSAVIFPLWTSVVVRMYAFTILLQREGIVNQLLQALHLTTAPVPLLYTETAVALGMLYAMLPYAILPLYATFVNIDEELIRAAESLGASRLRAFLSVVVPLALPSVLASGAIVFVIAAGFYVTPVLLGGPSSAFLATRIDQQIFLLFDFPGAAATGTILLLAAVGIVALAWRTVGFERIQRSLA